MPNPTASVRDIDRGFKGLLQRLNKKAVDLTVGLHEQDGAETKLTDDEDERGEGTPLIVVALAHEFGLGVPRRSFIRDWEDQKREEHKDDLRKIAKAVILNQVPSSEKGLERLGSLYVAQVQKRISDGIQPALEEETKIRKGSSKPLIDTGQLRSSIAFAVKGKLTPSKKQISAGGKKKKAKKTASKKSKRKNREA